VLRETFSSSGRSCLKWWKIVLYRVVVGLILTISARTGFKKNFLCGPDGHCGEEIAVPVDYQGRQIQLTGWLEKPIGSAPFPVVIALHSCAGYTANLYGGALPLWVRFLHGQGYATFKLDSFTARGYSEVCATQAVTAADRARDVLAARRCWPDGRTSSPTVSR
jgi:hypothetical protein